MCDVRQPAAEAQAGPKRERLASAVWSKTRRQTTSPDVPLVVVTAEKDGAGSVVIGEGRAADGTKVHLLILPIVLAQTRILASASSCPPCRYCCRFMRLSCSAGEVRCRGVRQEGL